MLPVIRGAGISRRARLAAADDDDDDDERTTTIKTRHGRDELGFFASAHGAGLSWPRTGVRSQDDRGISQAPVSRVRDAARERYRVGAAMKESGKREEARERAR